MFENAASETYAGEGHLVALGVTRDSLSDAARASLSTDGYLLLTGMLSTWELEFLRNVVDRLAGERAGMGPAAAFNDQAGTRLVLDLRQEPGIERLFLHPVVLAAARHVVGPEFRLNGAMAREPTLGGGHQNMHWDHCEPHHTRPPFGPDYTAAFGPFLTVAFTWVLDDFDARNGATRYVPRSHLRTDNPWDYDQRAPFVGERLLTAPAGSLFVYNAHLWHGGTENVSGARRRMINLHWTRRDRRAGVETNRAPLSPATLRRLSSSALYFVNDDA